MRLRRVVTRIRERAFGAARIGAKIGDQPDLWEHADVRPTLAGTRRFWLIVNILTRPVAGYAPWWVLLETIGRRSGRPRLTPLAGAPFDGSSLFLLAGYGEASAFVKNLRDHPAVRVKRRGRWFDGTAELLDPTPQTVARLGLYARRVLTKVGTDPKVVKITVV